MTSRTIHAERGLLGSDFLEDGGVVRFTVPGDLREAFSIAAVTLLSWRALRESQSKFGGYLVGVGPDRYPPEPLIRFRRRDYTLSALCTLSASLEGRLPAHLQIAFELLVDEDGVIEGTIASYPDAVEILRIALWHELGRDTRQPATEPHLTQRIRQEVRAEVWSFLSAALSPGAVEHIAGLAAERELPVSAAVIGASAGRRA